MISVYENDKILSKDQILKNLLTKFYSNKKNLFNLLLILNNKNIIKYYKNDYGKLSLNIDEFNPILYSDTSSNNIKKYKIIENYNIIQAKLIIDLFKIKSINDLGFDKKISLRLIDWFVINYCKKNKIIINDVNIYESYKENLKAYSKKYFDPFKRNSQYYFVFNDKNAELKKIGKNVKNIKKYIENKQFNIIETTLGQLNFFKWIISNNIYNYIIKNRDKIEKDMNKCQEENNKKKLDDKNLIKKVVKDKNGNEKIVTRKRRNELSKSTIHNIEIKKKNRDVISFK
jgi:hypothetical protein